MLYGTFASFSNVDQEQEGTYLHTDYDIIDVCTYVSHKNDALYQHLLLQQPWFLWALVCGANGLHALALLLIRDHMTTAGCGAAVQAS